MVCTHVYFIKYKWWKSFLLQFHCIAIFCSCCWMVCDINVMRYDCASHVQRTHINFMQCTNIYWLLLTIFSLTTAYYMFYQWILSRTHRLHMEMKIVHRVNTGKSYWTLNVNLECTIHSYRWAVSVCGFCQIFKSIHFKCIYNTKKSFCDYAHLIYKNWISIFYFLYIYCEITKMCFIWSWCPSKTIIYFTSLIQSLNVVQFCRKKQKQTNCSFYLLKCIEMANQIIFTAFLLLDGLISTFKYLRLVNALN